MHPWVRMDMMTSSLLHPLSSSSSSICMVLSQTADSRPSRATMPTLKAMLLARTLQVLVRRQHRNHSRQSCSRSQSAPSQFRYLCICLMSGWFSELPGVVTKCIIVQVEYNCSSHRSLSLCNHLPISTTFSSPTKSLQFSLLPYGRACNQVSSLTIVIVKPLHKPVWNFGDMAQSQFKYYLH